MLLSSVPRYRGWGCVPWGNVKRLILLAAMLAGSVLMPSPTQAAPPPPFSVVLSANNATPCMFTVQTNWKSKEVEQVRVEWSLGGTFLASQEGPIGYGPNAGRVGERFTVGPLAPSTDGSHPLLAKVWFLDASSPPNILSVNTSNALNVNCFF